MRSRFIEMNYVELRGCRLKIVNEDGDKDDRGVPLYLGKKGTYLESYIFCK